MTPGSRLEVDTATGTAIMGNTTDPSGKAVGVFGQASGSNGAGVAGYSNAASGGYGGFFKSNATSGTGVGVNGMTASTSSGSAGEAGACTAIVFVSVRGNPHRLRRVNYTVGPFVWVPRRVFRPML
jgi:hypothetical protein